MRTPPLPAASGSPLQAPAWVSRAFTTAAKHFAAGLHEEARQILILLLERFPRHADSLYLLASIAAVSGDVSLAEELVRQALAIDPQKAPFWVLLGNIWQSQARYEESLACYQRAQQLDPANVDVYYNAGNTFEKLGQNLQAISCFEKAIELVPNHLHALNNLANHYRNLGRYEDSLRLLERARSLSPRAIPILLNLGNVLLALGRANEALECFDCCVGLDSQNGIFRNNRANALRSLGRLSEAVAGFRAALALAPDCAEFWVNYAAALSAQGRQREACQAFRHILDLSPDNAIAHGAALFSMHYDPAIPAAELLKQHRLWAERHADPLTPPRPQFRNLRDPNKRLRVGYVSCDFRQHPVSFFTLPVFRHHSPGIEAICYSGVTQPDEWTKQVRQAVSGWRDTAGMSDSELCAAIRQDEIDILIDLSGHTAGNRLLAFAGRAAPVQMSWLGYFNTTGMRAMDYLVVDLVLAPENEEAPFVEQPLRLEGCYLCYEGPPYAPEVVAPPSQRSSQFTFGCFNTMAKITPEVIALWSGIVKQVPGSRILLQNATLDDPGCRELVRGEFLRHGLGSEQIELRGGLPHRELLARYADVDLALDPFPYNGGTTTCEALWMGVPVVTLAGDRFVSRVGATILRHAGCACWVAEGPESYQQLAVALAQDSQKLAEIRRCLRQQVRSSLLGDTKAFTRSWENALRMVWRRWCSGLE
ncbi:MAG: tetratricopeptide repeat protein [Bryobacteraceae bacterium]|nr:tetratricopeptide repeat protein [Bryobacteraceae bacterium]MDW8379070.1 tetratricopeptide repeat protein [Bryobacterales bacterium]